MSESLGYKPLSRVESGEVQKKKGAWDKIKATGRKVMDWFRGKPNEQAAARVESVVLTEESAVQSAAQTMRERVREAKMNAREAVIARQSESIRVAKEAQKLLGPAIDSLIANSGSKALADDPDFVTSMMARVIEADSNQMKQDEQIEFAATILAKHGVESRAAEHILSMGALAAKYPEVSAMVMEASPLSMENALIVQGVLAGCDAGSSAQIIELLSESISEPSLLYREQLVSEVLAQFVPNPKENEAMHFRYAKSSAAKVNNFVVARNDGGSAMDPAASGGGSEIEWNPKS